MIQITWILHLSTTLLSRYLYYLRRCVDIYAPCGQCWVHHPQLEQHLAPACTMGQSSSRAQEPLTDSETTRPEHLQPAHGSGSRQKKADPSVEFFMSTKFRGTLAKILKTDCLLQLFTNTSVELQVGVGAQQSQNIHVATQLAPIWSHLFEAEFGFEILLELWKDFFTTFFWLVHTLLPGQQPSVAGVCGPIRKTDRLLQKNVTKSAPVLSRRAPPPSNRWN